MEKENILFDLDGTIIDSSKGIYASVNYAMKKLNRDELTEEVLRTFIGPPLLESFMGLGMPVEEAHQATNFYRELYKEQAVFHVVPYKGIEETIEKLSHNKNIYLATSKPEVFAKRILKHLNLDQFFTGIYGADLEGKRTEKAAVIEYALSEANLDTPSTMVMIGDRKHDILGAKVHALESIGVLYGFGSREELNSAGADIIVSEPLELLEVIK